MVTCWELSYLGRSTSEENEYRAKQHKLGLRESEHASFFEYRQVDIGLGGSVATTWKGGRKNFIVHVYERTASDGFLCYNPKCVGSQMFTAVIQDNSDLLVDTCLYCGSKRKPSRRHLSANGNANGNANGHLQQGQGQGQSRKNNTSNVQVELSKPTKEEKKPAENNSNAKICHHRHPKEKARENQTQPKTPSNANVNTNANANSHDHQNAPNYKKLKRKGKDNHLDSNSNSNYKPNYNSDSSSSLDSIPAWSELKKRETKSSTSNNNNNHHHHDNIPKKAGGGKFNYRKLGSGKLLNLNSNYTSNSDYYDSNDSSSSSNNDTGHCSDDEFQRQLLQQAQTTQKSSIEEEGNSDRNVSIENGGKVQNGNNIKKQKLIFSSDSIYSNNSSNGSESNIVQTVRGKTLKTLAVLDHSSNNISNGSECNIVQTVRGKTLKTLAVLDHSNTHSNSNSNEKRRQALAKRNSKRSRPKLQRICESKKSEAFDDDMNSSVKQYSPSPAPVGKSKPSNSNVVSEKVRQTKRESNFVRQNENMVPQPKKSKLEQTLEQTASININSKNVGTEKKESVIYLSSSDESDNKSLCEKSAMENKFFMKENREIVDLT